MLTLIVVSHVICSRVQHTKHKLFVGLFPEWLESVYRPCGWTICCSRAASTVQRVRALLYQIVYFRYSKI